MKVIIKDTGEIKDVSFGYAVNYLIPQGLAVVATKKEIKKLEIKKLRKIKTREEKKKEDKALAQKLVGKKVIIKAKAGKTKKLFGRVTKKNIIKALGVDSKRVEVILKEPIKKLGKHKVDLKIGEEKISINVEVVKE